MHFNFDLSSYIFNVETLNFDLYIRLFNLDFAAQGEQSQLHSDMAKFFMSQLVLHSLSLTVSVVCQHAKEPEVVGSVALEQGLDTDGVLQ